MPSAPTYTLTHEDGSEVTAQEVYDAFMAGPVILEQGDGGGYTTEYVATGLYWQGGTASNGDPANVNYAQLVLANGDIIVAVGTQTSSE